MKKLKKTLVLLLSVLMLSNVAFANNIKLNVNNNLIKESVNPISQNGRILVPLRVIFEALNAKVNWDNTTKTVIGSQEDKKIVLQMNNKIAQVNGNNITLDVPGQVIKGSVYVPVRFIAESLGAEVEWDSKSDTVFVSNNGNPISIPKEEGKDETSNFKAYQVTRVVDGDTIKVVFNGKEESVRLIGVDTPESVHPDASKNIAEGKIASEFTRSQLEGREVKLEFDVQERDRYGRLLAYVWVDGIMFNKTLLSEGYAQIATFPPNVKYVEEFKALEKIARDNNKGLWADGTLIITPETTNGSNNSTSSNSNNTTGSTTIDSEKDGVWIKGNRNSKIYHVPSGRDYYKVSAKNIVWFETEKEAQEAGYRRAKQ